MKREAWQRIFRYIFEFIVAGLFGWVYEVITVYILYGHFVNRGILHLPIIPIYAAGAFILLAMLGERDRHPLFVFLFSAVVTTAFELGASYLLEFIFHRQFWTYENWWGSIQDRSSLISSAIFGVLAVGYFFWLHPLSGKLCDKLPKALCISFSVLAAGAVIADTAVSVWELLAARQ
ncbi:MAG: putative ABC transporter permease [Ruminococcus sp.]|nr:putative ABC transporter permease [Ruminococcus sp.]